jgi:hypothetical protein
MDFLFTPYLPARFSMAMNTDYPSEREIARAMRISAGHEKKMDPTRAN